MAVRPTASTTSTTGATAQPVHAFKPTSGTVMGVLGLAAAGMVVVLVVVTDRSVAGLRTALVAALAGLLVWMVLLRPRVRAYADTLLLRNMASDTSLPLAGIESVVVRHTLNVWVDGRRYTCSGIGRSTRSMLGAKGRGPAVDTGGQDYAGFVESTIEDLAGSARRDRREEPPPVRRRWALPELAALVVLSLALVGAILL